MLPLDPSMPAHPLGARVYIRNLLEKACGRALHRLWEDQLPSEKEAAERKALRHCAAKLLEGICGPPPRYCPQTILGKVDHIFWVHHDCSAQDSLLLHLYRY